MSTTPVVCCSDFHLACLRDSVCVQLSSVHAPDSKPGREEYSVSQEQARGAQSSQEVTALEPGKTLERECAEGQKHIYQLTLSEGDYASVTVEQSGIDLVVRLFAATGQLSAEFDAEVRAHGTEKIELVASATGSYRLEVEPKRMKGAAGRYAIHLTEPRSATQQDRSLQEARVLLAESLGLSRAGKSKDALPLAERALEIREKILGSEDPDCCHHSQPARGAQFEIWAIPPGRNRSSNAH